VAVVNPLQQLAAWARARGVPLHPFHPRLLDTLPGYGRAQLGHDLAAGLTVGIVALPLAMAFAIASGLPPQAGLITAIVAGFLIAALGGSNVQIGGPAGAYIVIVYGIIERFGLANLLIATMLAGVLLFLMGLFKLGRLVRYIPVAIVIGFTNGIAVLIGLSQLKDLLGLHIAKMPADFFAQIGALWLHRQDVNLWALAIGLTCLAVVVIWPKSYGAWTGPGWGQRLLTQVSRLPGTAVALVGASVAVWLLALPVATIGSRFGEIPQGLPPLALPELSWASAKLLLIPTVTLALLGAIESLLCARVADNLTPELPRHDPDQELMAQGVANFVTPLFGGMPATGTIARTVTNVRAGGRTPVAGITHAAVLLACMLVAAPLAQQVPLAALAGILLFVAWNMGEWRAFAHLGHYRLPYRVVLVGTFVLTVVFDLTVAVEVGLLLACGFFIYRMATQFAVTPLAPEPPPPAGWQVMELYGSLFFGAIGPVDALPAQLAPGTRHLVLDLHRLVSLDTSGADALTQLHQSLARRGITLWLARPNAQPASLLTRAGVTAQVGAAHIVAQVEAAWAAE